MTEWNIVQQADDTKVASKEKTLMKSKPMNVAAVALFNFLSFYSTKLMQALATLGMANARGLEDPSLGPMVLSQA